MKTKLCVILFLLVAKESLACLVHPAHFARVKNDLVMEVLNQYGFDVLNSEVTLKNYQHQMLWRFTNMDFMCHDTDISSGNITVVGEVFNYGVCSVNVEIVSTVGPQVEGGPSVTKNDLTTISKFECKRN